MPDNLVYLSLGSNLNSGLGDRAANLEYAIAALPGNGFEVLRRSAIYETEPVDLIEQPWFLNCVVEGQTLLPPEKLLEALQGIERELGSKKLVPRGPRVLDLDILLYGISAIHTPGLEIPHPRMAARRFVLVPLAELSPDLRHPVLNVPIAELLASTPDKSVVSPWHPPRQK